MDRKTDLSHLSLLFRHGSQLMAFRARLVGGRPSLSLEGEEARGCTMPAVLFDLDAFGRGAEGRTVGEPIVFSILQTVRLEFINRA